MTAVISVKHVLETTPPLRAHITRTEVGLSKIERVNIAADISQLNTTKFTGFMTT